jgi:hypothetical protein
MADKAQAGTDTGASRIANCRQGGGAGERPNDTSISKDQWLPSHFARQQLTDGGVPVFIHVSRE